MFQILFSSPTGEKFCKQCKTVPEKDDYVKKLISKNIKHVIIGEPDSVGVKSISKTITQYSIKPSVYLHIVFGEYAKDVLPIDNKTYTTRYGKRVANAELPTEKQINYLRSQGIFWLKGLTRKQADKLCKIVYERDKKGFASPWQLKMIQTDDRMKKMSVANKHLFFSRITKEQVRLLMEV